MGTSRRPALLVASMGGVATTALLEFLEREAPASVNPPSGFVNPLKHAERPPELGSIRRALFLVGDPRDSLISLFRRGRAAAHLVNTRDLWPSEFRYPDQDAWAETVERFGLVESEREGVWVDEQGRFASDLEALGWLRRRKRSRAAEVAAARAMVAALAGPGLESFEAYLEAGIDAFGWSEQLEAWRNDPARYPRLLIRYDALWERLGEVFDFLEVSSEAWERFPAHRPRRSRWRELPRAQRQRLDEIYGALAARIEAMAPVTRISEP